jgi:hypothetical protein
LFVPTPNSPSSGDTGSTTSTPQPIGSAVSSLQRSIIHPSAAPQKKPPTSTHPQAQPVPPTPKPSSALQPATSPIQKPQVTVDTANTALASTTCALSTSSPRTNGDILGSSWVSALVIGRWCTFLSIPCGFGVGVLGLGMFPGFWGR